jgi:16S rRNA (guanine527-N7)-methyltransferase
VPRTDDEGDSPVASETLELVLAEARQLGFLGPGPLDPQLRHARGFAAVARPLFTAAPRLVDMGAGGGLPGLVVAEQWPEVSLVLLEANERRSAFLRRAVDRLELGARVSVLQERAEVCGRDPDWRGTFDGAIARSFGRPAVLAECTAPLLKVGAWVVVSEPPTSSPWIDRSDSPSGVESDAQLELTGPGATDTRPTEPALSESGQTEPGQTEPGVTQPGAPDSESGGPGDVAQGPTGRWLAEGLRQCGLEPGKLVHAGFDYQLLRQAHPCPERFPRRNGVPAKKPLF